MTFIQAGSSAGSLVQFIQAGWYHLKVLWAMSLAWMRRFPRHLGRARSIQIAVAGYPCLDECHEGTAAGIYAIRRLKFKRCGELALRLSSRLTFAWGCVAVRAIHSSRCISAGLLVNFIEVRIFSVVVHANHLTVETLPQILVVMVPHAGPLISAAPDSQGIATDICSGILTVR